MGKIDIKENLGGIEGLYLIIPQVFNDKRGCFLETYSKKDLGIHFVQDNQSVSYQNVLRGLHYQKQFPQSKLVSVAYGEVFDIAVDLRQDSPTYGQWHAEILNDKNHFQMLIPQGFAHGFLTLSPVAVFTYKCDDYYHPDDEGGIIWNDPTLNIEWPTTSNLILSNKDTLWSRL